MLLTCSFALRFASCSCMLSPNVSILCRGTASRCLRRKQRAHLHASMGALLISCAGTPYLPLHILLTLDSLSLKFAKTNLLRVEYVGFALALPFISERLECIYYTFPEFYCHFIVTNDKITILYKYSFRKSKTYLKCLSITLSLYVLHPFHAPIPALYDDVHVLNQLRSGHDHVYE